MSARLRAATVVRIDMPITPRLAGPLAAALALAASACAGSGDPASTASDASAANAPAASDPPSSDPPPPSLPPSTPRDDGGTFADASDGAADAGTTPEASPPAYDAGLDPDAGLEVIGCDGNHDGAIGARFMGIPAYCQNYSGTHYYQCDELGNRWARDALGHPNITNVAIDSATIICKRAAAIPSYSVWGPHYRATAGHAPVPGDLVVWSSSVGHVVVVTSVSATSVSYMQQNDGIPTDSAAWDATTSFFTDPGIDCWIHAEPFTAEPPPSLPDCGCFDGDGDYCGLAIVDHEAWYGCDARVDGGAVAYDTLYACAGGVFTAKTACDDCFTELLSPAVGRCM